MKLTSASLLKRTDFTDESSLSVPELLSLGSGNFIGTNVGSLCKRNLIHICILNKDTYNAQKSCTWTLHCFHLDYDSVRNFEYSPYCRLLLFTTSN